MNFQTQATSRRIALGAMLLLLAATASSCGMALPTSPALDSGVAAERHATTTTLQEGVGAVQIDDYVVPSGGPDVTNQPPAGEEIIPTPGSLNPGNSSWGHSHKKPKNG